MKDKIAKRTQLSIEFAGRLIVLKYILAAMPVYIATLFPFAKACWSKMEKCMRKFC